MIVCTFSDLKVIQMHFFPQSLDSSLYQTIRIIGHLVHIKARPKTVKD